MDFSWLSNAIQWLATATVVNITLLLFFSIRKKSNWTRAFNAKLILFLLFQLLFLGKDQLGFLITSQAALGTIFLIGPVVFFFVKHFFGHKSRGFVGHIVPMILVINLMAYTLLSFKTATYFACLHLSIYSLWSLSIIQKETTNRGISIWSNPGQRLTWFRNYVGIVFLLISYQIFELILYQNPLPLGVSMIVSIAVIFILRQITMETDFYSELPLGQKYAKSSLNPEQKYSILNRLETFMEHEKYYLDPNASLSDLSGHLNTTSHNLSQVISENKGSFFDMISMYRMRTACQLLKDPKLQQLKVEEIANQVGYNSKSAFNTAFKKHTGKTPTEFKRAKDVLTYGEEHLPSRGIRQKTYSATTFDQVQILIDMINNFFKIFFRNQRKNKLFSLINLSGLIIGFTSATLIYLFISYELSYDHPIPDSNNIYRLAWYSQEPQTRTPHPMAMAMYNDFPEVVAATSISPWYGPGLTKQKITIQNIETNVLFDEDDFYFADSTFFDVFGFQVVQGDPHSLNKPGGLVITESMATKYFGDENPIGKSLTIGTRGATVTVTTVVKDPAPNLHFHFNFLLSYVSLKAFNPDDEWYSWGDFGHFNYIKVQPETDPLTLESKIPEWVLSYLQWPNTEEQQLLTGQLTFGLQPIRSIHLTSDLRWELENNGNMMYLYILGATLIFILLIVSINYINLTTAKSIDRAKEIGIRKTLGAVKSHLSLQFFCESLVYVAAAMVCGLFLAILLLNQFNELSGQRFIVDQILNPSFLLKIGWIALIIGVAAGLYPSLKLASLIPSEVLKGKFTTSKSGQRLRNVLVVVQFCVSAVLICGSLIVLGQIDYLKSKPLGFDKEFILSIPIKTDEVRRQATVIQNEFDQVKGIVGTSLVSNLPGSQFNNNPIYHNDPQNQINTSELRASFGTFKLMGINVVEGRSFDRSYMADSAGSSFIVNQAAVTALALDKAIGAKIHWLDDETTREGTIVGVIEDFHYKSLHTTIKPLIIQTNPSEYNYFLLKADGQNMKEALESIEEVYLKFEAQYGFEYAFLDQEMERLYLSEERTFKVFSLFAGIALFLACMGLLGIAIAVLRQRIKEIGVRKILGATAGQISRMIFLDFGKLILMAILIGLPVAYYLMSRWISEFPYQAGIGPMPFLLSASILLIVAVVTISATTYKIAHSNPVKSLRSE